MTERWKDVPGYSGLYQVSDLGHVKSLGRWVNSNGGKRYVRERILKASSHPEYPAVFLAKQGKKKNVAIHDLIMRAFVGPPPKGKQVCHNDGNHWNSVLTNLRYGTPKENQADRRLHGTTYEGEDNHLAKLTEKEVKEIRRLANRRLPHAIIATRFNVTKGNINWIVKGHTWKHIP